MICASCGAENREGASFCESCGAALARACPQCGAEARPEARFCDSCGHRLDPVPSPGSLPGTSPPLVRIEIAGGLPTAFVGGRYQVQRFLGEGSKKRVYLVHDSQLDRDVAFALLKNDGLDADSLTRIRREAQAMGRLGDHPHIVTIHDIGDEAGQPYIVSQFMAGGDLAGVIGQSEERRLPIGEGLRIVDQVCQALEHAHTNGVIHRDVKPSNVWLTADGTAKLGDFGLAVALDRSRLTQAGMMVGTVAYMSPEQALGGEVTPRSDLYSLGCLFYELVTGRPPFIGDESVAIVTQHLNTPPVSPSWHVPDLAPGLEELILRLLQKDAEKRPTSAADVRQALSHLAQDQQARPAESPANGNSAGSMQTDNGNDPVYRQTFVGRESELRQLQSAFDSALSGQGSLVTLVGEPGIGKTALSEQLATYVAVRGGKTLVGHCYEEGSLSLPYLAFVEALRTYVLNREPEDLKKELGTNAGDVARIVSEIRERVDVEPRVAAGNPEEDRWRLLQAVSGFLRNASTVQPLLLVLEDLHWADRGTLDLLLHLARNLAGSRLLVIGTYRDVEVDRGHPLSNTLAELRRATSFQRIALRGLTVDEVHRMMNVIRGQDVPWSRAEAIHRQTEGNPLFVQEVLRYLVEEGLVVREGGQYVRTDGSDPNSGIPEGLRDVIGKRLSRLSEKANQLLSVAAVIGRDFRLDVLQQVAGLPEDEIDTYLKEAMDRSIVEERQALGALAFRFTHAFFRQTLYEELFPSRRLRLHQQVARGLEVIYVRRLEEHASELAEHYAQSTDSADLQKALHYSEVAADRSTQVFAYSEAARQLERALQIQEVLDSDDTAKRCDLLLALGDALMASGEPQRVAEQVAKDAFDLAEGLAASSRASAAGRMALVAMERYGGVTAQLSPEYRLWAERLDRYATDDLDRACADAAMFFALNLDDQTAAVARARSALQLARKIGTPTALFQAGRPAVFPSSPFPHEETYQIARELASCGRSGVDLFTLARTLYGATSVLWNHGDRAAAEAVWREIEEMAGRTNDTYVVLRRPFIASVRAALDGRLEEAVAAALDLRERAEELGSGDFGRLWGANLQVRPLILMGRAQEAETEQSSSGRFGTLGPLRFLALAHLGQVDECREWVEKQAGRPGPWSNVLMPTLECATLVGATETAAQLAAQLLRRVPPSFLSNPEHAQTSAGRLLSMAAVLEGKLDQAEDYCRQAIAASERARFRPELALCYLQLAEVILKQQEELEASNAAQARDHLDFAIREFEAMKMAPSLERALALKTRLNA